MKPPDRFREALETLKYECPLPVPVTVQRVKIRDFGDCDLRTRKDGSKAFVVRVNTRMSKVQQVDVLIHEWSHALAWSEDPAVDAHGPDWGVAYARCYQAVTGVR